MPTQGSTFALALNDSDMIGGSYTTGAGAITHGFIGTLGGPYTTFDYSAPGFTTVFTQIRGLDNAGDAVGYAQDASGNFREFLRSAGGTVTTLVDPSTSNPLNQIAGGINSSGSIAGAYKPGTLTGYILSPDLTTLTPLAFPGAGETLARGINDAGTVVGFYEFAGLDNGFSYSGGSYNLLDDPLGILGTFLEGINNAGDISGAYEDAGGSLHGILYDPTTSAFTTLDAPGSTYTQLFEINNLGQVAVQADNGSYIWSPEASVPEPVTLALVGLGLAGLGFSRRKRSS